MSREQLCLRQPEEEADVFVGLKFFSDSYKMNLKNL